MRVDDHSDASVLSFNLSVHLSDLALSEVLRVKDKVLVALGIRILVRPLNVHPEYIDGEAEIGKVAVTLHNHFSADVSPLAEVEAKRVNRWHGCESRNDG